MLKTLEDDLLSRLSSAGGNLLGDTSLVENLETTKRTAAEIEQKVAEAKVTSIKIDQAREHYRPAAARASLLYFILNDLNTINPIYQFSLKARVVFISANKLQKFYIIFHLYLFEFPGTKFKKSTIGDSTKTTKNILNVE